WHDQPDHERSPCGKAARHPVRLVVELLYLGQHPAARLRAHVGAAAHDLRDGHHTDIEFPRDIFQTNGRAGCLWHGVGARARHISDELETASISSYEAWEIVRDTPVAYPLQ